MNLRGDPLHCHSVAKPPVPRPLIRPTLTRQFDNSRHFPPANLPRLSPAFADIFADFAGDCRVETGMEGKKRCHQVEDPPWRSSKARSPRQGESNGNPFPALRLCGSLPGNVRSRDISRRDAVAQRRVSRRTGTLFVPARLWRACPLRRALLVFVVQNPVSRIR